MVKQFITILLLLILAEASWSEDTQPPATKRLPDDNYQPETKTEKEEKPAVFNFDTWSKEAVKKLEYETARLRLKADIPNWYYHESQREAYLASTIWEKTEEDLQDAVWDSLEHATIMGLWETDLGKNLKELGEELKLRVIPRVKKTDGRDSRNETTLDFLFGGKQTRLPDPGIRLGDRPEILLVWFGGKNGVNGTVYNNDGTAQNNGHGKIRHELSWKVTDLTDPLNGSRIQYEIDEINGWFGIKTRYDFDDRVWSLFFDDLPVGDTRWISIGTSYHLDSHQVDLNQDNLFHLADGPSLSFTIGYYGSVRTFWEIFDFTDWQNPFKARQKTNRMVYLEKQRQLYAATR